MVGSEIMSEQAHSLETMVSSFRIWDHPPLIWGTAIQGWRTNFKGAKDFLQKILQRLFKYEEENKECSNAVEAHHSNG